MVKGIGIDTVYNPQIESQLNSGADAFFIRTFTEAERKAGDSRENKAEYYASRFAVKEAVFKAVAPLLNGECMDLRIIETLNRTDGSPYVNINDDLKYYLDKAGIHNILISITTENEYSTAVAIAI